MESMRPLEKRFHEHFDLPAVNLPVRSHAMGCKKFMDKFNNFKSDPSTLTRFKRKNTSLATL